jgi:alpha-galactosidase
MESTKTLYSRSNAGAFKRVSLLAAFLMLGTVCALAQTNLTGFWVFRVPTGDGNYRESFLDLKQAGEALTGKVLFGEREMPISDGTVKDGKFHFVVHVRFGEQDHTIDYEGTMEGSKISMAVHFGNRPPMVGELEHSTPAAAAPPPRLPIPALHDVPDNGLVRTPPMGWNSWNKFAGKIDDATVRAIADAMVSSGMRDAGYIYLNIDDTWEAPQRDPKGNILTNRKFPDMKALADYVHSKGLKIGIYSSPGPKTCAGYEGSYGHEKQDADTYAAWGFDYLKYDWCSAGRIYKDSEMRAVYQKMGDALQATGRPIVFSLCQYGRDEVWKWGSKVGGNLWRTTGDIQDRWKSMERIGFSQFDIAPFAKPGHFNDPDMLEIGNGGMSAEEYRVHMSLWSLLAAPLLAGNDIRTMSDETKSILLNREVIAIDQDPLVKPARLLSKTASTDTVVRSLKGDALAVGLFNRGGQPTEMSIKWADLDLAGKKFTVRDLWKHSAVPVTGDGYSVMVAAHGVVLLKLTPKS